jgi:hypothetical protein
MKRKNKSSVVEPYSIKSFHNEFSEFRCFINPVNNRICLLIGIIPPISAHATHQTLRAG